MEAVVTMKGKPQDFDLIREALANFVQTERARGENQEDHPANRREAKANAVRAAELLKQIGG